MMATWNCHSMRTGKGYSTNKQLIKSLFNLHFQGIEYTKLKQAFLFIQFPNLQIGVILLLLSGLSDFPTFMQKISRAKIRLMYLKWKSRICLNTKNNEFATGTVCRATILLIELKQQELPTRSSLRTLLLMKSNEKKQN